MVKTLPPNDSFHDFLMGSTRKSKTMLSILKVWLLTLQMSGLLSCIWLSDRTENKLLPQKNTLSTSKPLTKPFMEEVVKEECRLWLEILGGISVHRSLTVSLAGPTSNMTSFIPRNTKLAKNFGRLRLQNTTYVTMIVLLHPKVLQIHWRERRKISIKLLLVSCSVSTRCLLLKENYQVCT